VSLYDVCHQHGGMTKHAFEIDPKRLGFILARYKFVAKMLAGKPTVLEIGCADGIGSHVVAQSVGHLTAIDLDAKSIAEAQSHNSAGWPISFACRDAMKAPPLAGIWDAVYCLDVLEHIEPAQEHEFLTMLHRTAPVCIIGTPSLESQVYASELSKQGHINCKSGEKLRFQCSDYWAHVFMFAQNDEVVHTGHLGMAHYLFALCIA